MDRDRDHAVELSLEKRFFDTTELDVAVGYATIDDDIDNRLPSDGLREFVVPAMGFTQAFGAYQRGDFQAQRGQRRPNWPTSKRCAVVCFMRCGPSIRS